MHYTQTRTLTVLKQTLVITTALLQLTRTPTGYKMKKKVYLHRRMELQLCYFYTHLILLTIHYYHYLIQYLNQLAGSVYSS